MQRLSDFIRNPKAAGLLIFLTALLLYVNTIPNQWAVDDGMVIWQSRSVRSGLAGLPAIFAGDFLESSSGDSVQAVAGGRYRPLTPAIYAVCAELLASPAKEEAGRPVIRPQGHPLRDLGPDTFFPHALHLLNTLLYALLCLVLYRLLLRLMRDHRQGALIAFLAALLFVVHPLHTEAVANAKGLDEIMALLLSLLSLRLFVLAVDKSARPVSMIAGGAVCLLLAALAKEHALTFLAIIPLTLWFFRRVPAGRLLGVCSPAVLAAACYLALRMYAVGSLSLAAPDPVNMMNNPFLVVAEGQQFSPLVQGSDVMVLQKPNLQSIVPMPAGQRLATVSYTWLRYLQLFIFPAALSYDYYPGQIAAQSFSDPAVLLSVLLHVGLLGWAIANARRRRTAAYGILFYFLSFSVASNLVFPIGTNMAERLLFMPSVGLCIAVAAGIVHLTGRVSARAILAATAVVCLLLSIRTVARNRDWKDNLNLMWHDLPVADRSAKIRSDYGEVALARIQSEAQEAKAEGRTLSPDERAGQAALLRETLPLYKEALDVYPMYGLVWFNLARTNQLLGEMEETSPNERLTYLLTAIAAYRQTDVYKPRQYLREADTAKSMCYASLGKLYGQQFGDMNGAMAYLQEARRINARNGYALFLLGTAYDMQGNADSAYYFTHAAYQVDTTNRDYLENYAQIIRKQVGAGRLEPSALKESGQLLRQVANQNALLPDDNPQKAALSARTQMLIQKNDSLQVTLGSK